MPARPSDDRQEHAVAEVRDGRILPATHWAGLAISIVLLPALGVLYVWRPLLRPGLGWNHDRVVLEGGEGLARRLGASLLVHD